MQLSKADVAFLMHVLSLCIGATLATIYFVDRNDTYRGKVRAWVHRHLFVPEKTRAALLSEERLHRSWIPGARATSPTTCRSLFRLAVTLAGPEATFKDQQRVASAIVDFVHKTMYTASLPEPPNTAFDLATYATYMADSIQTDGEMDALEHISPEWPTEAVRDAVTVALLSYALCNAPRGWVHEAYVMAAEFVLSVAPLTYRRLAFVRAMGRPTMGMTLNNCRKRVENAKFIAAFD